MTTTPLLIFALSESARPRSASLSISLTLRRASFTPATSVRRRRRRRAAPPPPIATFVFSWVTSRASRLPSLCSFSIASTACASVTCSASTIDASVAR